MSSESKNISASLILQETLTDYLLPEIHKWVVIFSHEKYAILCIFRLQRTYFLNLLRYHVVVVVVASFCLMMIAVSTNARRLPNNTKMIFHCTPKYFFTFYWKWEINEDKLIISGVLEKSNASKETISMHIDLVILMKITIEKIAEHFQLYWIQPTQRFVFNLNLLAKQNKSAI